MKKATLLPENVTDWDNQWKDVRFYDDLRIVGLERGRSAAHFLAISTINNYVYTIFMDDMLNMIINNKIVNGCLDGEFIVKKKGKNLGVCLKDTTKRSQWGFGGTAGRRLPSYI